MKIGKTNKNTNMNYNKLFKYFGTYLPTYIRYYFEYQKNNIYDNMIKFKKLLYIIILTR